MSTTAPGRIRRAVLAIANEGSTSTAHLSSLPVDELDAVVRAGTSQGLATVTAVALRSANLPVPPFLQDVVFGFGVRKSQIMAAMAKLTPALDATGIAWAVLKGPATAASHTRPELRDFTDLDLLVAPRNLTTLVERLRELGIDHINRNWDAYIRHGVAEFPVMIDGVNVDVHWNVIPLERIRRDMDIDTDRLLERRRRVRWGATEFPALEATDHLMHLCVHAGLSGGNRAGWLRDIAATVRHEDIDWSHMIAEARTTGTGPLVAGMLERTQRWLGTSVPPSVITDLAGHSLFFRLRRLADVVERRRTREVSHLFSGFFEGAARSSSTATLRAASWLATERIADRAGRRRHWSTFDPHSELYWRKDSVADFDEYVRAMLEAQ